MKKIILIFIGFMFFSGLAFGQNPPSEVPALKVGETILNVNWDSVGSVLIVFLVLSIVFETAMTPVFNWRIFLLHFEGKGVKIPLTVISAFIVFWAYNLDIVANLLTALGHPQNPNLGGRILTAFLIAGGSDGVFRIFTKLGIRNPTERKEKAAEARKEKNEAANNVV